VKQHTGADQQGFTLLEIALALAILAVLSFYLLDMVELVRQRSRRLNDRQRMEYIAARIRSYYLGMEHLPLPAAANRLPTKTLSLAQGYRYDRQGRFFTYLVADTIAGFEVDGTRAAGVLISLGPDQQQDYIRVSLGDPALASRFTSRGDDLLLPLDVTQEAIEITLHELEVLNRRVEAYDRFFAGIQNNPATSLYGDSSRTDVPPIIDPDSYDAYYEDRPPHTLATAGMFPELYPYKGYYTGPGALEAPAPSWADLIYEQPDHGWPNPPVYSDWPARPPDPPTDPDLPPGFADWPQNGDFGAYPDPVFPDVSALADLDQAAVNSSYALIDEDGCVPIDPLPLGDDCLATSGFINDPSCGRATLDRCDPGQGLDSILSRYGLGEKYRLDPWNEPYRWGSGLEQNDRRYRTFFSMGPDRTANTDDDITLY